ncbi:hypothetical protein T552_03268 [Pneumocystis carinii B80]|uniref:Uncharacterized protein n=1 Tax=Pneumocystis carinii (strain B80) TaxID=1408658 RepID=A0A0W4ZC83_PNEC8|nr:hypothetical protein T552_03268 [Pneumocystis carinii B80]KTW25996.1 hypothetical protein T552_03268 [Pneumocystis carinii B80]
MSSIRCCCGTDCLNIRQNRLLFKQIEKDMQIASELGQYLLSEYRAYNENAEYREKLFKLEIYHLKIKRDQIMTSLSFLKKRNKELEEEICRINEKNEDFLRNMEKMNILLSNSESNIQDLSDTLEATKLELERSRSIIDHKKSIEKHMDAMEIEKKFLRNELEQSLQIGIFFKKKWQQSERLIDILKEQMNGNKLKTDKEKENVQTLIDYFKNYPKIEMNTDSMKSHLIIFIKELISKNSSLKKICTELYDILSIKYDETIHLQQFLSRNNNYGSLSNDSYNLRNLKNMSHFNVDRYLFSEKKLNQNSLNQVLNENINANILHNSDKENQKGYSSKFINEAKIKLKYDLIDNLFMPVKFKKSYFNNSKITRSFSAPEIMLLFSSSSKSQNTQDNSHEKTRYLSLTNMFNSPKSVSINNKRQNSCLNLSKELQHSQYNKLNSNFSIYLDAPNTSFFKDILYKKPLHEVKLEDLHDSFLLRKPWTTPRNFSPSTQFISPVISTFSTNSAESSVFLNNDTKAILSNTLLKSTITNKHFLSGTSKKKKADTKPLGKNIHDNQNKSMWDSFFNKWPKLIHTKHSLISTSTKN